MIRKLSAVILTLVLLFGVRRLLFGQKRRLRRRKARRIAYALNIVKETDTDKTLTRGEAAGIALRHEAMTAADLKAARCLRT